MKELTLRIVRALADRPEAVALEESERDGAVLLRLKVADEDKGRVIGKQGKVIKAIRALVSAAASKRGQRASVEVE